MNTKLSGRWGESLAAEFLRNKRYSVISIGYRTRFGEIDIIAKNKKYIVFVEVKTRKNSDFAAAREFVDSRKIQRIRSTAKIWLAQNETGLQPRFDVIEVYAQHGINTKKPVLNHFEDAF